MRKILHWGVLLLGLLAGLYAAPYYTWKAIGGQDILGYYIYWGTNPHGVSIDFQRTGERVYEIPDIPEAGDTEYYLRVREIDRGGHSSEWETMVTYVYSRDAEPLFADKAIEKEEVLEIAEAVEQKEAETFVAEEAWAGEDEEWTFAEVEEESLPLAKAEVPEVILSAVPAEIFVETPAETTVEIAEIVDSYNPELPLTRREMFRILVTLLEKQGTVVSDGESKHFSDVDAEKDEIARKSVAYGLLKGYPDGTARLGQLVRKAEAACILARYIEASGGITLQPILATLPLFSDVPETHWARSDIAKTQDFFSTKVVDAKNGKLLYQPQAHILPQEVGRMLTGVRYARATQPELLLPEGRAFTD